MVWLVTSRCSFHKIISLLINRKIISQYHIWHWYASAIRCALLPPVICVQWQMFLQDSRSGPQKLTGITWEYGITAAPETTLLFGDVVMKLAPKHSSKLLAKFLGPLTIIAKMYEKIFNIIDNATHAIEVAHVDRLKKVSVLSDESSCEPQQYKPTKIPR